MLQWLNFVKANTKILNFGFLFNFFSSYGQTFFISLFVPYWIVTFGISNAAFGSIYSVITIISAFLLSVSGRHIDNMPLSKFSLIVFTGLFISVIILSQAASLAVMIIGLLLVRWFGQGMMTHTSSTGIARYFENDRGKALGITSLGHPAGQFLLPLVALPFISSGDWRKVLLYLGISSAFIVVPALLALSKLSDIKLTHANDQSRNTKNENYLKSRKFWIIAVNVFIVPFISTAVFLYQYIIGQEKGWDTSWIAFSFSFYAIFFAISLFLSGNLIDRYSGVFLFPLYLIPVILGLITMAFFDAKWIAPVFYSTIGISAGMGSTVKTALQAEVYGTGNLGKIRSYFTTILVVSTALGPPLFGYFIDRHLSFKLLMLVLAASVIIVFFLSMCIWKTEQPNNSPIAGFFRNSKILRIIFERRM